VTTAECSQRCEAKATGCKASPTDAQQACSSICSSATQDQLTCLEGKSCGELGSASTLEQVCPKTSGGGTDGGSTPGTPKAALGDSCTCPDVSGSAEGYCSGTSNDCDSSLRCLYETGSSGKGKCFADSCCDDTTACKSNSSLLKSCSQGTCKETGIGFYCGK